LDLKTFFRFREADRLVIDKDPFLLGVTLGFGHNFGVPAEMRFDPVDQWSRITAISE
jgi:hypothetical protein